MILQHPAEFRKAIGTARLAHLCIRDSVFVVGVEVEKDPKIVSLLASDEHECVLLYPGKEAWDIRKTGDELRARLRRNGRRLTVFVVDGTWNCAKKLLATNPRIAALPRISFTGTRPSEYRIRKQPASYCLSSIEAIQQVLEVLDPAVSHGHLLEVFRWMVNRQISYRPTSGADA